MNIEHGTIRISRKVKHWGINRWMDVTEKGKKKWKSRSLCTWHNPTENCPNSGICRRISSVTKWTPRCWGLKLILRWNQAEPICIPLLVPRWLELDAIAGCNLIPSKYSKFCFLVGAEFSFPALLFDPFSTKKKLFSSSFSLTLFTRSLSLSLFSFNFSLRFSEKGCIIIPILITNAISFADDVNAIFKRLIEHRKSVN